jgi:hypothetical protein
VAESATTRGPGTTLEPPTDETHVRLLWTDDEIREGLRQLYERRNLRAPYGYVAASRVTAYGDLRKLMATQRPDDQGWYMTTNPQVRSRLYDDSDQTPGRISSVVRFVQALEQLGAIELDVATVGTGKTVGKRFRPLPVPAIISEHAPVAQLDRATACGGRRRRAGIPRDQRVGPWRRRAGRHGVPRPEDSPSFFASRQLRNLGPAPGEGPKGPYPPGQAVGETCVRARTRAWADGHETHDQASPSDQLPAAPGVVAGRTEHATGEPDRALPSLAAVEALRETAQRGEGGLAALLAAARDGADPVAVAEAWWWELFDCRPKLSGKRADQLRTAVRQLDRYARYGAGQPGAGIAVLLDLLETDAEQVAAGLIPPIHSLGHAVCELRQIAAAWRRAARGLEPVRDTGQLDRARAEQRQQREWERRRAAAHVTAQARRERRR